VAVSGCARPALPPSLVRRVVAAVLDGEGTGEAVFSVTFMGPGRMRALNRRAFGRDRATDVIAFELPLVAGTGGDLYLCPGVARSSAAALGVSPREELVRLLVHGTLHALGYDHPEDGGRMRSAMWRRQERYVRRLSARSR
jgi:probable rRNA maturation factor